jgi:hypothetical protein
VLFYREYKVYFIRLVKEVKKRMEEFFRGRGCEEQTERSVMRAYSSRGFHDREIQSYPGVFFIAYL